MLRSKLKSLKEIQRVCVRLKKSGKRIVFTNGCFDLLHYGHVKYLEDAKGLGEALIVALNSDASVRRIKGRHRPIVDEKSRAMVIAGLESVDYAVIFGEDTPINAIKLI